MGGLFSKPKPPKPPAPVKLPEYKPPPEPEKPPEMPTVDDEVVQKKKRRDLAKLSQTSGRASTMLADGESGLG